MPYKRRYARRRAGFKSARPRSTVKSAIRAQTKAKMYARPATIASVARVEKKLNKKITRINKSIEVKEMHSDLLETRVDVGQVNNNVTGAIALNVTNTFLSQGGFQPSEGTSLGAPGARVGQKIKVIGFIWRHYVRQQSAATASTRYVAQLWRMPKGLVDETTILNYLFDVDNMSQVIDANSARKSNSQEAKLIWTSNMVTKSDGYSGQSGFVSKNHFIKQNQILEFSEVTSSTQLPSAYQYFITVRANAGNRSTTTPSTNLGVPQTGINTGGEYFYRLVAKYIDP